MGPKRIISGKLALSGPIDLMESDRGPSIEEESQLKRTKIIHVRCLDQCKSLRIMREHLIAPKRETKSCEVIDITMTQKTTSKKSEIPSSSKSVSKSVVGKRKSVVPSVTPSKLMNMGKNLSVTKSRINIVPMKVWEFDFGMGSWGEPSFVGVEIVRDIEEGGFRMAKDVLVNGKRETMKVYTKKTKDILKIQEISQYEHARLSVQTQANARYICSKFVEKMEEQPIELPLRFKYIPSRMGMVLGGPLRNEYCMLEPYLTGEIYLLPSNKILLKNCGAY